MNLKKLKTATFTCEGSNHPLLQTPLLYTFNGYQSLGIHCFGNNAAEIIHIGQAVMQSPNNTIKYFVETTFNYPTMAEAYRVATLNGMNRLF